MADSVGSAAGSTISVSTGAPGTFDQVGWEAVTWVLVGEVMSISTFGAVAESVSYKTLSNRFVQVLKGSVDRGALDMDLASLGDDAGQVLLLDGAAGGEIDTLHSVKVTFKTGRVKYFQALVMSFTDTIGSPDDVITANTSLAITGANDVFTVAAP